LRSEKYLFDQMTRLPCGFTDDHVPVSAALARVATDEVQVVVDPHLSNRAFAEEVAASLGMPGAMGFVVPRGVLPEILRFENCDMYVFDGCDRLVFVACHEDRVIEGERQVWTSWPINGEMRSGK